MRKELEQKLAERRGKGKGDRSDRAATAQVGIVYLVGDKLWIDSTPIAGAGRYANSAIHEPNHLVMHFDPDGPSPEDLTTLRKCAHFLNDLEKKLA